MGNEVTHFPYSRGCHFPLTFYIYVLLLYLIGLSSVCIVMAACVNGDSVCNVTFVAAVSQEFLRMCATKLEVKVDVGDIILKRHMYMRRTFTCGFAVCTLVLLCLEITHSIL